MTLTIQPCSRFGDEMGKKQRVHLVMSRQSLILARRDERVIVLAYLLVTSLPVPGLT